MRVLYFIVIFGGIVVVFSSSVIVGGIMFVFSSL